MPSTLFINQLKETKQIFLIKIRHKEFSSNWLNSQAQNFLLPFRFNTNIYFEYFPLANLTHFPAHSNVHKLLHDKPFLKSICKSLQCRIDRGRITGFDIMGIGKHQIRVKLFSKILYVPSLDDYKWIVYFGIRIDYKLRGFMF